MKMGLGLKVGRPRGRSNADTTPVEPPTGTAGQPIGLLLILTKAA